MKTFLVLFFLIFLSSSYANKADVLLAEANCFNHSCSFEVTIKHGDEGWKHYANKFEILSLDRKILATRILYHPHVNEQPFRRSISNIKIPKQINKVIIRAHDLVHKYGGKEVILELVN